jgi:hypothetical protein
MIRRVVRTARQVGVSDEGLSLLELACRTALARRAERLDDDHDPHYLHSGRTVLILLLDTGELNPVLLAAAALTESQRPELRVPDEAVRGRCPDALGQRLDEALRLRAEIPSSDEDDLLERLVTAGEAVRRVALAERLDHARHAHMWLEGPAESALLDEVDRVWLPVAVRTHERLARRLDHWGRATRRRLGGREGP